MTLRQINQHVTEERVGPCEPRACVAVHVVLEEALVHVSIGRTLLQHIQTRQNLIFVLHINFPANHSHQTCTRG